jgi:hypothetical protein
MGKVGDRSRLFRLLTVTGPLLAILGAVSLSAMAHAETMVIDDELYEIAYVDGANNSYILEPDEVGGEEEDAAEPEFFMAAGGPVPTGSWFKPRGSRSRWYWSASSSTLDRYDLDGTVVRFEQYQTGKWRPAVAYDGWDNEIAKYTWNASSGKLESIKDDLNGLETKFTYASGRVDIKVYRYGTHLSAFDRAISFYSSGPYVGNVYKIVEPIENYVDHISSQELKDLTTPNTGSRFLTFSYHSTSTHLVTEIWEGVGSRSAERVIKNTWATRVGTQRIVAQQDVHQEVQTFDYFGSGGTVTQQKITTMDGTIHQYDVDLLGRATKWEIIPNAAGRPRGTEPTSLTYLYDYSGGCGRGCPLPSKMTYPSGAEEFFTFDAATGELVTDKHLDPDGTGWVTTTREIDTWEHRGLVKKNSSDAGGTTWTTTRQWAPRLRISGSSPDSSPVNLHAMGPHRLPGSGATTGALQR